MFKSKSSKFLMALIASILFLVLKLIFDFYTSKPDYNGIKESSSIKSGVKIMRDHEGVPHIYSENREDMMWALGYSMAQDRLFQYDMMRRAGAGRLSELFGAKTINIDILFRTLGDDRLFNDFIENIPDEISAELNAFYQGLNDYIDLKKWPVEYTIIGARPEYFNVKDSLYIYLYLAYSFSPMLKDKPMYNFIFKNLKNRKIEDLLSNEKSNFVSSIERDSFDVTYLKNSILDQVTTKMLSLDTLLPSLEGSNAWVISSKLAKNHKPILASDPHISFSLPNIWYEAHLVNKSLKNPSADYDFYAYFLPLVPYAAMGHSKNLGWGLTMSYIDDMDLIQEESGDFYILDGEKNNYRSDNIKIKVRFQDDLKLTVKRTKHGPIIDHLFTQDELEKSYNIKNVSLYWAFYENDNKPIDVFYNMSKAQNLEEMKSAVSSAKSPGMNILYADREDNIAHLIFGTIYKRPDSLANDIVVKIDKSYEEYSFEEKPNRINPKSGYLISTNDRPDDFRGANIRGIWYPKNRHDTVKFLIEEKLLSEPGYLLTANDMMAIQTSNLDIYAKDYVQIVNDILTKDPTLILSQVEKKALESLVSWDSLATKDSIGALIYHRFDFYLLQNILDELSAIDPSGKLLQNYLNTTSSWYFKMRLLHNLQNPWWATDKQDLTSVDSQKIVIKSFKQAINYLQTNYGDDISKWNWGLEHTIEFPHPLGFNKILKKIFNLGPYPVDGAINVVNHMRRKGITDGHKVKSGPSTRRVIDFSNPEISFSILPLGISEHPLSPYYDNQRQRFLNGDYRYQLMNFDDIEKAKEQEVIFLPVK